MLLVLVLYGLEESIVCATGRSDLRARCTFHLSVEFVLQAVHLFVSLRFEEYF